ncbi:MULTISPECIES: F0F1 ATP synthase subunit B [Carnobacterium]|uniref:ATP synthase subunit b n=2 Tax=Carnobacterium divergens TaxID=2748 RepID=A0A0R2I6A3_CARDV|nr:MULTISPECIES: F0F1 ATP synthase subunit B [Carnobacterium]ANZ99388.1 ATP synthase F0 subunit B [Carnobacterium divergens]KRN57332.1 ATP synthase F0F1 subunit B [Carnobacterium divergens DSM 20623]MDO0875344.1 F0F1 ATP synthase subunit B [Carnobacterium divergens]MDT1939942.1 F0F1 ATP synthase subunit B [Carnobacterium divergens]MDT1942380.1 F0F1 ATP synthase subunit B [Carnobacterium divergens]
MYDLVLGESTSAGDTIFVLLAFLLLLLVLKKFAWKPLMGIMEERERQISKNIDSAENSRIEANRLAVEGKEKMDETRNEALTILNNARENGERIKRDMLEKAKEDAERIKAEAQLDIEMEKQKAIESVKSDVSQLSMEIAAKLIGKELTSEGHAALIDEYIEGLADDK